MPRRLDAWTLSGPSGLPTARTLARRPQWRFRNGLRLRSLSLPTSRRFRDSDLWEAASGTLKILRDGRATIYCEGIEPMEKYKNVRKRPEKKPRFDKVSIMLRQSSTMIMRRKSRPNVELG